MTDATPLRRLTVYILRGSPFHNGHAEVLKAALKNSQHVLVLIGSAHRPRTIKNPWTAAERSRMVQDWYDSYYDSSKLLAVRNNREDHVAGLTIAHQRDYPYSNQRWLADVQAAVSRIEPDPKQVWLTGADRDSSTFYLREFQYNLDLVEENREVSKQLSATTLRDIYFARRINENHQLADYEMDQVIWQFMPFTTFDILRAFEKTREYTQLVEEYHSWVRNKKAWSVAPYEPTFITVDSVVVCSGHVLLVQRRNTPGKGLWALPGGFLNQGEWSVDGAIRELNEETKIDASKTVLMNSIRDDRWFEDPNRSLRGRTITHAFLFRLPEYLNSDTGNVMLPKVKGSDDAKRAKWFPLSQVLDMSHVMFEDHYDIVESMVLRMEERLLRA